MPSTSDENAPPQLHLFRSWFLASAQQALFGTVYLFAVQQVDVAQRRGMPLMCIIGVVSKDLDLESSWRSQAVSVDTENVIGELATCRDVVAFCEEVSASSDAGRFGPRSLLHGLERGSALQQLAPALLALASGRLEQHSSDHRSAAAVLRSLPALYAVCLESVPHVSVIGAASERIVSAVMRCDEAGTAVSPNPLGVQVEYIPLPSRIQIPEIVRSPKFTFSPKKKSTETRAASPPHSVVRQSLTRRPASPATVNEKAKTADWYDGGGSVMRWRSASGGGSGSAAEPSKGTYENVGAASPPANPTITASNNAATIRQRVVHSDPQATLAYARRNGEAAERPATTTSTKARPRVASRPRVTGTRESPSGAATVADRSHSRTTAAKTPPARRRAPAEIATIPPTSRLLSPTATSAAHRPKRQPAKQHDVFVSQPQQPTRSTRSISRTGASGSLGATHGGRSPSGTAVPALGAAPRRSTVTRTVIHLPSVDASLEYDARADLERRADEVVPIRRSTWDASYL
jgi:hypothetical protein